MQRRKSRNLNCEVCFEEYWNGIKVIPIVNCGKSILMKEFLGELQCTRAGSKILISLLSTAILYSLPLLCNSNEVTVT